MIHFPDYLTFSRDKLLLCLSELSEELANLHVELGYTRAAELQKRVDAWANPRESSVTGRSEDARYAAAIETISTIELESRQHALLEEKFLILKLLDNV